MRFLRYVNASCYQKNFCDERVLKFTAQQQYSNMASTPKPPFPVFLTRAIKSTRIVFSSVHELHTLKRFVFHFLTTMHINYYSNSF